MKNFVNGPEIPMGFGMALAQNADAMRYFTGLTREAQQKIIDQTHAIGSKKEMQSYVSTLAARNPSAGDSSKNPMF